MKTEMQKRAMNFQTDAFGIVHHARYLEMMEEARWQYCYENNLMEAFHKNGIYHVVVNINIDYSGSARVGDLLTFETEIDRVTENTVIFRQTASRGDKTLVVAQIANVFMRNEDRSIITVAELATFWDDLKKE